ncbi:MAG TPA: 2-hydroxyacyl-CoA dehydratase subunit D [Candidatus Tripitaka californicus]|uniref:2-hydroxyacyl-CoA dehydratase subunit D n=1 Tax=Candidatus Tripitaka californicus TaxID=3367616 RepID=UPI004028E02F|nr:2-hydroxyacyl-CoA dehydratase [Planctomycetota bacterium]
MKEDSRGVLQYAPVDRGKIGYLSIHVPEEIILGAGRLPYRLLGRGKPVKRASAYLPKTFDPSVLDSLEGAIEGEYGFLEGVIVANVSDAHRRLYDAWRLCGTPKNVFFLDVPKGADALRVKTFSLALSALMREMETALDVRISPEGLREAIGLCNETRVLLQRLAGLRRQKRPPLSGHDFFDVVSWAQRNDKSYVNQKLRLILQELEMARGNGTVGPRLMLTGSPLGSPELISLIERLGAQVVCEDLCTGMQYFSDLVEKDSPEPLNALARRYLDIPTARMADTRARWGYLHKMAEEYDVDGVVYFTLKFDDIYLFEYPFIRNKFQKAGYRVLLIEAENFLTNVGQIETRVQAFTEMLG